MKRMILACVLAVAAGGAAAAQTGAQTAASGSSGAAANNSVTLAKPPQGTAPPATKRPRGSTNLLNNTPLTPQIALHPTPTIGSGVSIAGPGGTTTTPANTSN